MKILITGVTGLIGRRVSQLLAENGHRIVGLTRNKSKAISESEIPIEFYEWNSQKELPPIEAFVDVDAVINLMGENIAEKKWNREQKRIIYNSRVISTRNLVKRINSLDLKLKCFTSASAIGCYIANIGDNEITETEKAGNDFLAKTCCDWEEEALLCINTQRVCLIRTGVVLSRDGGALKQLTPIFEKGLGGIIGDGEMWMSWIHIDDVAKIFIESLFNISFEGVINATSPNPVKNKKLTTLLGKVLGKPTLLPVPKTMLKLMYGEMSQIMTDSQRIIPKVLLQKKFEFLYSDLEKALSEIYNVRNGKTSFCLTRYQWIPGQRKNIFSFFSNASNLEMITPDSLNFKILEQSTHKIEEGTEFKYRLKLSGIAFNWETLIKDWEEERFFSDFQKKGPYKYWHHYHWFFDYGEGTLMLDKVIYQLPMGTLGKIFGFKIVEKQLNKIFSYRKEKIANFFKVEK